MSEHIQPSPDPHPVPVAAATPGRTPGVSYEKSGFDFWLILRSASASSSRPWSFNSRCGGCSSTTRSPTYRRR